MNFIRAALVIALLWTPWLVASSQSAPQSAAGVEAQERGAVRSGPTKLPRVDITHPDFGQSCAGVNGNPTGLADPKGKYDSTCAFNAAVTYLVNQSVGNGTYPALYIPRGVFRINGTIRVPPFVDIMGDGPQSSVLQETNPTANLITYAPLGGAKQNFGFFSGTIRDVLLEGSGHSTMGTLLELQGSTVSVNDVGFFDHGGVGFNVWESSERAKYFNLQFNSVRWPIIINSYEQRLTYLTINSPGSDATGYCWNVNCIDGVFPSAGGQSILSATGNGTTQTYVMSGTSPVRVGNYINFRGISEDSALNGYYKVSGVADNTPERGRFTITVAGHARGSGGVTAAKFATALIPDNRHAAVWVSGGYENTFEGGEIKPLEYLPAFKFETVNNTSVTDFYNEGYINSINPGVLIGGLPDQMFGDGKMTSCPVSTASGSTSYPCIGVTADTALWWPARIGLAADIPANGAVWASVNGSIKTYVFPCDYDPSSATPSSCNPTVQRNQYEIAAVGYAEDTQRAYFVTRNQKGSTAPADTAWVKPVFEDVTSFGISTGTGLTMARNELVADNPRSLKPGYVPYCADATAMQCAEIEAGGMDDGYIHFQYGWNTGATNVPNLAQLISQDFFGSETDEATGPQWIKVSSRARIYYPVNAGGPSWAAEDSEISTGPGSVTQSTSVPRIQVTSPHGQLSVNSPLLNYQSVGSAPPYFTQEVGGDNQHLSKYLGANPGTPWTMGKQFYNSRCWYGSGNPDHSDIRMCVTDAHSGAGAFEVDTWSGSAWTSAFKVTGDSISGQALRSLAGNGSSLAGGLPNNRAAAASPLSTNGGHTFRRHTIITGQLTPAAVAPSTCAAQTFGVNGLEAGDIIINGGSIVPGFRAGLSVDGVLVTGNNRMTANFCNHTASPIIPPSGIYTFDVEQ